MTSDLSPNELVGIAAQAAADKLAFDIAAYNVAEQIPLAEVFLICSAKNERQVAAIVDAVAESLAKAGEKLMFREGRRDDQWVLLNYPDIVVHIQHQEARDFYSLDRLWADCPRINLDLVDYADGENTRAKAAGEAAATGPFATDAAADLQAGVR